MAAQKLTQERVHEIIEQYAAEHDGQIPSTTDIIVLNDGRGSPSSANAYRKTYLALKQKKADDTAPQKNPMAGFPEAIAEAVKAMELSVQAKAKEEIDAIKAEMEKKEAEWQKRLDDNEQAQKQLRSQNAELTDSLKLKQFEGDTLREDIKGHEETIQSLVLNKQKLEGELAEAHTHYDELKAGLNALPSAIEGNSETIANLEKKRGLFDNAQQRKMDELFQTVETLSENVKRTEDSRQGLIKANTELSGTIAKQSVQYQAEIDRLNQLVDDLRQSDKRSAQKTMAAATDGILQINEQSGAINTRIESIEQILESLSDQANTLTKKLHQQSSKTQGKNSSEQSDQ